MITKEYLQQELAKRIDGYKRSVETTTDNIIAEMKSILVLVDALPDYEKKYNEALERAQKAIRAGGDVAMEIVQHIFPELRESEDERIRKEIIKFIQDFCNPCDPDCDKWIAYLEKQKEQKPAESREEILHQLFQNGSITLSDYLYLTEGQKPAWSEEDESELTAVIYCVSRAIKASKDENERNSLLSAKKWLQDKLSFRVKSLRPSWKPSEEQMDALKELIDDANRAGWVTPGAIELYEQLKKL